MSTNGTTKNLFQKLAAISGELGAIAKDGKAPDAMGGFAFISHGAVTSHLRAKLADAQVAILPSLEMVSDEAIVMTTRSGERSARRIVVKLDLEFVNGENPEERHRVSWFGEGIDTADKALQKAATSAQKYALMKAFLVSDRDDPDGQEGEAIAVRPAARPPATAAKPTLTAEQRGELTALNDALPEDLRLTPEGKKALIAEGFEAAKEALLARHEEAKESRRAIANPQPSLLPETAEATA